MAKSISRPTIPGMIMGSVSHSFTLTPSSPKIKEGDLHAENLLFWDYTFLDFDHKSKLYVAILGGLKNNKVMITLNLGSLQQDQEKGNGKINVFFDRNDSNRNVAYITVPYIVGQFTNFYVHSPNEFDNDSETIAFTFPKFNLITILSVKIDIYQPFSGSRPR